MRLYHDQTKKVCGKSLDQMKKNLSYQQEIIDIYNKNASNYDQFLKFYNGFWQFFGFRYEYWRKKAISELNLNEGHVVVDLGCGTGLNFPYFEKLVGHSGRIIGVDISNSMLAMAKKRIKKNNWKNISLFLDDMANYKIPRADAIISTYSLGLSKSYDKVIQEAYHALKPDGKFVVLDFKNDYLSLRARTFLPFWLRCINDYSALTVDFGSTHPWKSVKNYFTKSHLQEFFGGLSYISVGIKTNKTLKIKDA